MSIEDLAKKMASAKCDGAKWPEQFTIGERRDIILYATIAHRELNKWRPISEAPRDCHIWAFNGEQHRMRWIEGRDYALWVYVDEALCDLDPYPDQPTHFRELPEPPTEGES